MNERNDPSSGPPLEGINVVEVGLLVQGPQAAATLGEWGADVVKVELPGFGDQSRWLPSSPTEQRSGYFHACNRGKRSITLDLRRPEGAEVFLRLCTWADIVISNFKPGTMDGWGLGYEAVAARNPAVIYATGSTFGTLGPDAAREGADLAAQAAGGLISTTGDGHQDPTPVGFTSADHTAAQNLVAGVLAALYARTRTGRGQHVATSLVGGQVWAQASELTAALFLGRAAGPAARGNPLVPGIYGIFPTADSWMAVVGVPVPRRAEFFDVIGRPELTARFPQPYLFEADKAALFPLIDDAMRTRSSAEWAARFEATGFRYAHVQDHAQVVADPSVRANGYVTTMIGPDGDVEAVRVPVSFSETKPVDHPTAPGLGEHTFEILDQLGYTAEEIAALAAANAI
jgi:crotonobetainyl-CoA:carnitine CoA-transferase CaiB-like acyl-CoA transferase